MLASRELSRQHNDARFTWRFLLLFLFLYTRTIASPSSNPNPSTAAAAPATTTTTRFVRKSTSHIRVNAHIICFYTNYPRFVWYPGQPSGCTAAPLTRISFFQQQSREFPVHPTINARASQLGSSWCVQFLRGPSPECNAVHRIERPTVLIMPRSGSALWFDVWRHTNR